MTDGATIFVIDDDPLELRMLSALLKAVFPLVETFSSAANFLAAYDGQPGCLVLDVAMPDMSGLELQRRLRDEKIYLPVVFVTGYGNVPMAVEAMQLGAVNFLEKPVQEHALWDSVQRAIELDQKNRLRRIRHQMAEEAMARLTAGERDVLNLVIQGKMNKEIATELDLSIRTIEDRRAKLMKKMGAESLAELIQLTMPACSRGG